MLPSGEAVSTWVRWSLGLLASISIASVAWAIAMNDRVRTLEVQVERSMEEIAALRTPGNNSTVMARETRVAIDALNERVRRLESR